MAGGHGALESLAARFWDAAGGAGPFPRDLETAVGWTQAVTVARVPGLCPALANLWLGQRGLGLRVPAEPTDLRGVLVACRGHGVIFIDAQDPADEQRFTLAHELAHYLADYAEPRCRALERLGPGIAAVLDGERPPAPAERADALLADVVLGVYRHLLPRVVGARAVEAVEERADRLALELLVPWQTALCWLRAQPPGRDRGARVAGLTAGFTGRGGLPPAVARAYAARVVGAWLGPRTFAEWLDNTAPGVR